MKFIDMHCDTISRLYDCKYIENKGKDCSENLRNNSFDLSLNGMKKAGYILQNFALFIDTRRDKDVYKHFDNLYKLYLDEMKKNKDIISPIFTYEDIEKNMANNMMSSLLSVEEGEVTSGDINKLDDIYNKGVRMMTLIWNNENSLDFPSMKQGKLKDKGIDIIKRMNEIGMIIDVSHLNDEGIYDVLKYTNSPFVASHSNAKFICNHPRNLNDDLLRKMGDRYCVTGINYYAKFLNDKEDVNIGYVYDMIKHIKHIINVAGSDMVGLGSDYDGIDMPVEWGKVDKIEYFVYALEKAGFSYELIDKICYKNVLRLYKSIL